ncbi:MAG TPA: hypothetical protein VGR78_18030 [Verrucomicrobiae bacterium]|nr:hypothetical protein [Verrucomicrobiae bacterium]
MKNGALLRKASDDNFAVFVTSDKNLPLQQNVSRLNIAVVVLDVLESDRGLRAQKAAAAGAIE